MTDWIKIAEVPPPEDTIVQTKGCVEELSSSFPYRVMMCVNGVWVCSIGKEWVPVGYTPVYWKERV